MDFISDLPVQNGLLIGLGTYTLVAVLCYYYPELVPRKKQAPKRHNFVVVSHRGGSGESSENTLAAFKYSESIGVDVIELDVHLTKDGQVVVSHDNNLKRLTGVDKLVSDFNYNELPQLNEEHSDEDLLLNQKLRRIVSTSLITNTISSHRSVGSTSESRRIPLLEDVFNACSNAHINLDIKINNDELIRKVNDLIVKYKREHTTVWGSFNETVTSKCYALNPKIQLYVSAMGCWKLFLLMVSGLLPFVTIRETHLEIIMPNELIKSKNGIPLKMLAPLMLIKICFIRKSFVRLLQKKGITVYFWVLNSEAEFRTALDMGVDGIITDFPAKLIAFLKEDPVYSKKIVRP